MVADDQLVQRRRGVTIGALLLIIVLSIAACGDEADPVVQATDVMPTRTLVLPTATPTSPPVSVTATSTELPGPSALLPGTQATTPAQVSSQIIIDAALDDLVNTQNVSPADVRLMSLERFVWRDEAWECKSEYETGTTDLVLIPGYRVIFSAGSRVFVYHTDGYGVVRRCADRDWLRITGVPVLTEPIAEAMVDLGRRDAARRLDVDPGDLKLVSMLTVIWPDASLGCPKAGVDYDDRETPGYRIVLATETERVIYHTSVQDLTWCAPEEEILPGALQRALP